MLLEVLDELLVGAFLPLRRENTLGLLALLRVFLVGLDGRTVPIRISKGGHCCGRLLHGGLAVLDLTVGGRRLASGGRPARFIGVGRGLLLHSDKLLILTPLRSYL